MNLCLVRHTSVNVPSGICYGQSDVGVNEATFEQEAKSALLSIPDCRWDAVYTSPLSRCVRLAEYAGWKDARRDSRLLELDFGDWETKYWSEIDDPNLSAWFDDYVHVRTTNGESFLNQYERVVHFVEDMKRCGYANVLAFAHGGVVESARIYAGAMAFEGLFSQTLPYGGVEMLEF